MSRGIRINLDEKAKGLISEMFSKLKEENQYVKVSASDLVSWILSSYREKTFEKEIEKIAREYFDSKRYLRDVVKQMGEGGKDDELLKNVGERFFRGSTASKK